MNKKKIILCALAFSTIDTSGVLPLSTQTVQADTQEEFKEAIKKLTDKKSTTSTPKKG